MGHGWTRCEFAAVIMLVLSISGLTFATLLFVGVLINLFL